MDEKKMNDYKSTFFGCGVQPLTAYKEKKLQVHFFPLCCRDFYAFIFIFVKCHVTFYFYFYLPPPLCVNKNETQLRALRCIAGHTLPCN